MVRKRFDNLEVEGRVQTMNPFKEINGKTYGKAHQEKQKDFIKKHTEELEKDNVANAREALPSVYLNKFKYNINDEDGLKKAYNNTTDKGLYYHPDNRTLYIAGTKDIPTDVLEDALIPFHMVHHSTRYRTADHFLKYNSDKVDTVIGHSLGGAVSLKLNQDYRKRFKTRTYGAPVYSYNMNTDENNLRFRSAGDPVSMFDRGAITINKNAYNPLYNHGYQSQHYGDIGKEPQKESDEKVNQII